VDINYIGIRATFQESFNGKKIATGDMEHKGSQTQDCKIKRRNFVAKVEM